MNSKSILYFSFLIIGLVLSLGLVCANENIMDNQEATTVGGVLSAGENDNLKVDIEAPDVNIDGPEGKLKGPKVDIDIPDVDVQGPDWHLKMPKAPMPILGGDGPDVDVNLPKADIDISGPKAPMPDFYTPDGILGQQQQQQQQQQKISSLVIEKFWENNDSGSITYVEIEVYRVLVLPPVPQQQKAGEDDLVGEPIFMTINGVERQVEFVGRYNITKDNNWKLALDNLFFNSIYDYDTYQFNTDVFTYFVKEVNLPDNVFPVYSNYSRHVDNDTGLFVYWNLTNSIIPEEPTLGDEPPEEEVNETPEENETESPSVNNPENPEVEDNSTAEITEENKTAGSVDKSTPNAAEKKVLDVENATGNPLVLLLMVIAVLCVGVRRRD